MGWTKDQEKAIYTDTGNGNLLVSANAGSGKTAVLVERVLQKILSGKGSIDRLLIVTFTEAAAAEMREKIVKRLFEYIDSDTCTTDAARLIKSQIRMLQTADIMTIDAFCNRVVQNNFHALGIDPDIRICDNGMAKLLCEEALNNLFSRIYKEKDERELARLHRLTDFYAKDRSNERLGNMILAVYRFTESFAEPLEYLRTACESYALPVLDWPAVNFHMKHTQETAKACLDELSKISYDKADDETAEFLAFMLDLCENIFGSESWDEIYGIYKEIFGKKAKITALLNRVNDLPPSVAADKLNFQFRSLLDIFTPHKSDEKVTLGITKSEEDTVSAYDPALLKEEAEDIAWIVEEFTNEYSKLKEKQNVYEFSDIEHLTYELFNTSESVRQTYINKYDEILIDEYQDTNMLQDSIFRLISNNNIFMVGDLKQSIYRFRKGDPYIFREKSEEYEKDTSPHTRINLSQNFRSRQEVLRSVNAIFEKIMSREAGDVTYTDGEYITRLDEYEYYPAADGCKAELHYLAIDKNAEVDRDLTEARFTAQQISRLLTSGVTVYDKDLKAMRPIKKKDIVILESSVKYNSDLLTDELNALGIESYVDKGSFFDRREINVMLSLLSVINNSHQDVPLISVMRSPIGGFTDNDLAQIRIHAPNEKYFISALDSYCKDGEGEHLQKHCRSFLYKLRRWREYIRKKSVAQLIWAIYEETYFYDIMGAIDEGEEAQTNLRLLYERAEQYEGAGFKGLFNFIKYISRLEENGGGDIAGAKLIGENHDVVRIMTIHKSKGLEFPYVFLLGAGRDFNNRTDFSAVKLHKSLGFGLPHIYYDKHYAKSTYAAELISKVNKTESISERMRLLYVAMTRPKEKLTVIVARYTGDNETATVLQWQKALTSGKMLPKDALNVKGFYGWLCPAAYASPEEWDMRYHTIGTALPSATSENEACDTYDDSVDLHNSVFRILDYEYPYPKSRTIPSRTSVTQLKELTIEREKELTEPSCEPDSRRSTDVFDMAELMFSPLHQKPAFMLEKGVKPTNEIGTLYHLVMSEIDYKRIKEQGIDAVDDELSRLVDESIVSNDDMEYVIADKIKCFFASSLGKRMINSQNVNREKPFQINISAAEYDPALGSEYDGETVILQGIIDCFFEEDDGYVLFDYKTDKVKDKDELRQRYSKQLDLYAEAIRKLTGKSVTEKYLYLFDTGDVV